MSVFPCASDKKRNVNTGLPALNGACDIAIVPAADITTPGTAGVRAINSALGGDPSNKLLYNQQSITLPLVRR